MPRPYTFPTLYDEALQISITKLKECGYLNSNQIKSGRLTWSRNEHTTGRISIRINTCTKQPYIELGYKYRDETRNYKVRLVSIPSNLGKGEIWYFRCPQAKKRCRKLYLISGYFLHREAFSGCMYMSQTHSKKYRELHKELELFFESDALSNQLYKKHFKKTYGGKPTKRYLHIIKKLNNTNTEPHIH